MFIIGVLVHPVDTAVHTTVPEGWRWACHLGDQWDDIDSCLNAGWAPTESEAAIAGEAAGVCAVKVTQLLSPGTDVQMPTTVLEFDPILEEA